MKGQRRSGRLVAKNDHLIELLINDPWYQVREDGTIWTCRPFHTNQKVIEWRQTGKAHTSKNGLVYFHLKYRQSNLLVHRIVFRKFVGPLSSDLVVNHIDRNSLNNAPQNLELISQRENSCHAKATA